MTNKVKTLLAGVFVALTVAGPTTTPAAAGSNFPGYTISKLNGKGFRICKSFGKSGYTAVVRGLVTGGGGRDGSGFRNFQVRTCFKTKSECDHFISRIHHTIGRIERIRHISCRSRSG